MGNDASDSERLGADSFVPRADCVLLLEISKLMGNSVTICEKHYAAHLPGAHERLAGILDAQLAKVAPPQEPRDAKVGAQVTRERKQIA